MDNPEENRRTPINVNVRDFGNDAVRELARAGDTEGARIVALAHNRRRIVERAFYVVGGVIVSFGGSDMLAIAKRLLHIG